MSVTRPPRQPAPALTCDCHFHIFGPFDRFPAPEAGTLFDQFVEWVPDAALRRRVLVDNAARLYGF